MNCIVADDESLAIDLIVGYIEKVPFLKLEGTFTNPFKAWEALNNREIDLVFLDINMPGLSGLQLAEMQVNKGLKVIFTTAYSEYAIEGFNLNAIDYLLKPFSFDRFLKAVNKAHQAPNEPVSPPMITQEYEPYLLVKSEHKMVKVNYKDIHYIEGFKDYLKIFTEEEKPILTIKSMKSMEDKLPPNFIRIHKSFLISIDKILEIRNYKVKVKDTFLQVSDTYRNRFRERVIEGKL